MILRSNKKNWVIGFALSTLLFTGCDTTSGYSTYLANSKKNQESSGPIGGKWTVKSLTCNSISNLRANEEIVLNVKDSYTGSISYSVDSNKVASACSLQFPISVFLDQKNKITVAQLGDAVMNPPGCYQTTGKPAFNGFTGTYLKTGEDHLVVSSGNLTDFCGTGTIPAVITLTPSDPRF